LKELFSNFKVGPLVGVDENAMLQEILNNLLDEGFVNIACITDKKHEAFKMMKKGRPEENPVAVLITIEYLKEYD
jgi:hypothetical protein